MKIKLYTLNELVDKYGKNNVYTIVNTTVGIIGKSYAEYLRNLGKVITVKQATVKQIEKYGAYTDNDFIAPYFIKVIDSEEIE